MSEVTETPLTFLVVKEMAVDKLSCLWFSLLPEKLQVIKLPKQ
jgi:hypothetical protein